MIYWMIKKMKKKKVYPRKRRLFEHEVEPLVDELYLKHKLYTYEIKEAKLKIDDHIPLEYQGKSVKVLFYGRTKCEIQFVDSPDNINYVDTKFIDFSPKQSSVKDIIEIGEYVRVNTEIKSDDELKGTIGKQGDVMLLIKIELEHEHSYWLYNEQTKEAFRASFSEFDRLNKKIPIELI